MLKKIFHFYNILLVVFYLFPGSLLGLIFYKNISKQPQITQDFTFISSNHIYAFFLLSILGLYSVKKLKNLTFYLICLSVILELFHLIIPNRSFQNEDLIGNVVGVFLALLFFYLLNLTKKLINKIKI